MSPVVPAAAAPAPAPARADGWWDRFGLPTFTDDWRDIPPLESTVVRWIGANRFELANGQVWESVTSNPYELEGKRVAIAARPFGKYALVVEGRPTSVRVIRIR